MKRYIKPQIEVTNIETEEMLCTSGTVSNDFLDKDITSSDQILSKDNQGGVWGLDDDDE